MNINFALTDQKPNIVSSERRFPTWHFSMMNDGARNASIKNCIRDAGVEGKTVFEIGTGAGLTAMLFAKYGAGKIFTCESDDQMYSIAQKTIEKNNLSNKITIFHGTSSEFLDNFQSNFSPDIVFTETLDCGVIGEGFHCIARDIQKLNTNEFDIFPNNIIQYGYMIDSKDIRSLNSIGKYCDFDLSDTNIYSTKNYFPVRLSLYHSESLSASHPINSYLYTRNPSQNGLFSSNAYRDGTCHGILSFFHAFYGNHVVSNDTRDKSHWHQAFHPLDEPICIEAGKTYKFSINHSGLVSLLGQER